ncbi:CCN family member 2a isoform X2 [Scyliorhinus canicula]|uniref:CCN family member 2a isoform X2 n=1 Tax=Scyliorhinus canicula TaxID=7830 RepID=UPI0018F2B9BD|nr:CCN family member 2a isoform X2 [Scyliorhinus canicula]
MSAGLPVTALNSRPSALPECLWSLTAAAVAVSAPSRRERCAPAASPAIYTRACSVTSDRPRTAPSESVAAKEGAPCFFDGVVYRNGETFQSGCKYKCTCLDGSIGCVPVCSVSIRLASPDCPMPKKVKVPGKCCEEWVCEQPRHQTMVGPALAAYREEATYGPDPSMFRANCLVQTTEWSACSKTCGMGISSRVTNDNRECRLEKQTRLCMVRPCEMDMTDTIKKGKRCIRTPKVYRPTKFEFSGCTSVKSYRAKFCGVCTDGRCCTPHRTATLSVEFKCPDGQLMKKKMMFIKTCACHYNCPMDNDVFQSLYYRKMMGDMA